MTGRSDGPRSSVVIRRRLTASCLRFSNSISVRVCRSPAPPPPPATPPPGATVRLPPTTKLNQVVKPASRRSRQRAS